MPTGPSMDGIDCKAHGVGEPQHGIDTALVYSFVAETPVAKARPRVTMHRGRPHAYTPPVVVAAELAIRKAVAEQLGEGWLPIDGAIRLRITVYRKVPDSVPKAAYASALPTQRPDLDNYFKLVSDALTVGKSGWGVWNDDAQIVEFNVKKRYAIDRPPGWHVVVERASAAGWS